ncbi:MAG: M48 family metallopeptidase [Candidatus Delongbacteria bacterium]|nr:M48 family metallopeptidase [Candidatus Delongbacteria bacterium]
MRYHRYNFTLIFLMLFLLQSCAKVPLTGRRQLDLIPNESMLSMSFQQYDQFLEENQLSKDKKTTKLVQSTGLRVQRAVEQYFAEHNLSGELADYAWEFNLVESDEPNAWCMPGGKVVVYTGILPITRNEAGLAVVMGHEIAHAIAQHGNERMSQGLVAQTGGMLLTKALEEKPQLTQQIWMTAFGLGAQLGVMLPYSRLHESEADHLGLIFMAMAGYKPQEALQFWQRMAELKGEGAPPEFLSTHPADDTRITQLERLIPEAMEYYNRTREELPGGKPSTAP